MDRWQILLVPVIGWISAQAIKYLTDLHKDGFQIKDVYTSGGFPSSHTSSTVSLTVYIGLTVGWDQAIFAVSALLAAIVMYDSLGVRRTVQEHTQILKEISEKNKILYDTRISRTGKGHSPKEVFGGLVLGAAVGILFAI